ncbi:MAG: single-stranded-DNA-specific exonuclease RecJ [Patescibacteria group bacterium]
MGYTWIFPSAIPSTELIEAYHPTIASILAQRGIHTKEDAEIFLNPDYYRDCNDPFLFEDMTIAVDRIASALARGEQMTIYCDYDVDGLSSGALLYLTIRQLGGNVGAYMNHREHDGYGLQKSAIQKCINDGTTLFITTDCGISNAAEIAFAKQYGADVIITDHHTVPSSTDDMPAACAIIHPLVRAQAYPCKNLAGGGTAYKLAQALIRSSNSDIELRRSMAKSEKGTSVDWSAYEKWLLDLVCLSTIGDCVPLQGENRMFVRYGLRVLHKTQRPGLQALLKRMRDRNMKLTSRAVSFFLAPRINAASRMEHAQLAFDLLTTSSVERAEQLAEILEKKNTERQKKTEQLVSDVREQLDIYHAEEKKILVGNGDEWPLGILGLVAGRLCDYYRKPVVLMTSGNGSVSGAARSIGGFHIAHAFSEISHYFDRYGGHQAAGGFALKKESSVEDVRQSLESIGNKRIQGEHDSSIPLHLDAEARLSDISWDMLSQLKKFEPYGQENSKPKIVLKGVKIENKQCVGKTGKHVRFTIQQDSIRKQCIGFSLSDTVKDLDVGDYVDIACELDENEWNGSKSIQISIIGMRRSVLTASV